jgi:hypothetical protein
MGNAMNACRSDQSGEAEQGGPVLAALAQKDAEARAMGEELARLQAVVKRDWSAWEGSLSDEGRSPRETVPPEAGSSRNTRSQSSAAVQRKDDPQVALRRELEGLRLGSLTKRAVREGHGEEEVNEAMESDDQKAALVQLLLHRCSRSPSSASRTSPGVQEWVRSMSPRPDEHLSAPHPSNAETREGGLRNGLEGHRLAAGGVRSPKAAESKVRTAQAAQFAGGPMPVLARQRSIPAAEPAPAALSRRAMSRRALSEGVGVIIYA